MSLVESDSESISSVSTTTTYQHTTTTTTYQHTTTTTSKTKSTKTKKFGGLALPLVKIPYQNPTPIQRKVIPLVLAGEDVVAMARTGSGKTASFLLPMISMLSTVGHTTLTSSGSSTSTVGHTTLTSSGSKVIRTKGLVLTPTRDLAIQTFQEFNKYNQTLRVCCFTGGESLETQFSQLLLHPDVIISTPGRLLHLLLETSTTFDLQILVVDEADRLFELGFLVGLGEIMKRTSIGTSSTMNVVNSTSNGTMNNTMNNTSNGRQTLLFSATMPTTLVDFMKYLHNPKLITMDSGQLSPLLDLYNFYTIDKDSSLLVLLKYIEVEYKDEQVIVFCSTKYHVEYLYTLLKLQGYAVSSVYGSMEPSLRKSMLNKFVYKKTKVMVVTDVAARGLDIPDLNNVIHYDFVGGKLFVHRSGRVCRGGSKRGRVFSLVSGDDWGSFFDLGIFLNKTIVSSMNNTNGVSVVSTSTSNDALMSEASILNTTSSSNMSEANIKNMSKGHNTNTTQSTNTTSTTTNTNNTTTTTTTTTNNNPNNTTTHSVRSGIDYTQHLIIGTIPQELLAQEQETLQKYKQELQPLKESSQKAYKQYLKTREKTSLGGVKESKKFKSVYGGGSGVGVHPLFWSTMNTTTLNTTSNGSMSTTNSNNILDQLRSYRPPETILEYKSKNETMKSKRRLAMGKIEKRRGVVEEWKRELSVNTTVRSVGGTSMSGTSIGTMTSMSGSGTMTTTSNGTMTTTTNDQSEFKMKYLPDDHHITQALKMDLHPDDPSRSSAGKEYDSKKRKMVTVGSDNKKRFRTDDGTLLPATYKSGRFEKWQKKSGMSVGGDVNTSTLNTSINGNGKKYRYNETSNPDPTSKSFKRKVDAYEAKLRKEGLRGKDLDLKRKEFVKSRTNTTNATNVVSGVSSNGNGYTGKGTKGKKGGNTGGELKTKFEIAKARIEKEKRREKTGRHKSNKKK